jgi:hypothetical protein
MDYKVCLITESQRLILINSENEYIKFEPITDIDNNYFISEDEYYLISGLWYLDECPSELTFIKDLNLTIYKPKPDINFNV